MGLLHRAASRSLLAAAPLRCCSQGLSSAPCSGRFAPGAAGMEKGERKCSCCPDATPRGEYFHLQTLALRSAGMFRAQTPRHSEKCTAGRVSPGRYLHRQHPQHPAASQPCFPSLSQHPDPPQLVAAGLGVASCIAFPPLPWCSKCFLVTPPAPDRQDHHTRGCSPFPTAQAGVLGQIPCF